MTAVVRWLEGKLSPNLDEKEWYAATLLYRGTSASLYKYSIKAGKSDDEEAILRAMVREARKARTQKDTL